MYCNYASAGYVYLTVILFIIKLFIKPDSPTYIATVIRQIVIISIFLITGMLAVPIQVLAI